MRLSTDRGRRPASPHPPTGVVDEGVMIRSGVQLGLTAQDEADARFEVLGKAAWASCTEYAIATTAAWSR